MINFDRTKRKNKIIAAILKSFTVAGVGWQWRNKKLPMGIASTGYYRRRASDFDFFNVVSPFVEEFLRYLFRNYVRRGLKSITILLHRYHALHEISSIKQNENSL